MYHSRKIGVFISHLFGEYQHNLCQGILDTAKEYGYLVEIFASTDGETPNTLAGEEGILTIPSQTELTLNTDSLMPFINRSHNTAPVRFLSSIRKPMLPIMSFWTTMPPLQI